MRRVLLVAGLVLLSSATTMAAGPIGGPELEAFVDRVVEDQMQEYGIAGATVSVVSGGDVVLSKGYGHADLAEPTRVDAEHTLFRVGSVSKLLTWTAVMQLAERGELDLDADVSDYLDFQLPQPLKGSPNESPPEPITLTHLMTHTAGFEDVGEGLFSLSKEQHIPLDEYVRTYVPARVFRPGEVAAYSNYGAALAGYIVERVSGVPFEQYVEENIFTPLGMNRSTFRQPVPDELSPDLARGYRLADGEYIAGDFVYAPTPAGGMSSTATDMAKFLNAHLQGGALDGGRILEEATARQMRSQLYAPHPSLDGMAFGFIEQNVNGRRVHFHGGSIVLFNSGLYLLPQENVGLFVSYSGGSHLTPSGLFQQFMDQYYPGAHSPSPAPSVGDMNSAESFLGEYHLNRRSFTTVESIISLMDTVQIDMDDDGFLLVTHLGETSRFVQIEPGLYRSLREGRAPDPYGAFRTLLFREDPSGRMTLLSDGPMSYTKAPWYATGGFTGLSILVILVILVSAPIYWAARFARRLYRRRRPQHPKATIVALGTATAFSVVTIGLLMGFLVMLADIEPAFGQPKLVFGVEPPWSPVLSLLPVLMTVIGAAMIIFTVAAWLKRYWPVAARIHYTLVTAAALGLLMILNYWNFL